MFDSFKTLLHGSDRNLFNFKNIMNFIYKSIKLTLPVLKKILSIRKMWFLLILTTFKKIISFRCLMLWIMRTTQLYFAWKMTILILGKFKTHIDI